MGKESRIPKERVCKECGETLYVPGQELAEHSRLCKRAKNSGLVLPDRVRIPKWS